MHEKWQPLPNESANDYSERVGGWKDSDTYMFAVLKEHFGMEPVDAKALSLEARSFWQTFFKEHAECIFNRGGTRYAAMRFVKRRNSHLRNGNKIFTQDELEDIVDSVGKWKK